MLFNIVLIQKLRMSMKDFSVAAKLGRSALSKLGILGDGAYSTVYKVRRLSDGKEYALKKVDSQTLTFMYIGQNGISFG